MTPAESAPAELAPDESTPPSVRVLNPAQLSAGGTQLKIDASWPVPPHERETKYDVDLVLTPVTLCQASNSAHHQALDVLALPPFFFVALPEPGSTRDCKVGLWASWFGGRI